MRVGRMIGAVVAGLLVATAAVAQPLSVTSRYAVGDALVAVTVGQAADVCTDPALPEITTLMIGGTYRVASTAGADTTALRVMVGVGTAARTPVGADIPTTPGTCVVVEVTPKTAASYTVSVVGVGPGGTKESAVKPLTVTPLPAPGVPSIRILGKALIAGRWMPIEVVGGLELVTQPATK